MKPTRTWILIADGARARILENDGPGSGLNAVEGMTFHGDHASTHEILSDRAGRTHSSVGPGRSAIEGHSDPHRELKKKFAHQLADVLAQGLERNAYDRLVIVAPPTALGDLRAVLPAAVTAKVSGEVAKDLTKTPNGEVAEHLKDVLRA
jgi:protein required for attachment to host cells